MSIEDRTTSAVFKREEQLRRWLNSDTNAESALPNIASRKIQFSTGCVFLAACAASDKDEVLRLLKEKADIDTANVDGLTALHQACIDDNLEMVEFLIEQGADVNRGDNEGWTPLHATASCGFVSIAKYLIESGADVAAVNNDGELPSDIAEPSDMEDLLQEMIDQKGIDPEEARRQEERIMQEDVSAWLSGSSDVDPLKPHPKTGATGLHVASAKGYIKVLSLLLQGEPDLDQQDVDGWTALHAAAHWGQTEAIQLLSTHFANFDIKNFAGQTAMEVADNQVLETLKDMKTKQAALQKDRPAIINRGLSSPKRRLSEKDKTSLVTKDVTTERQILDRTIVEEPKSPKEEAERQQDNSLPNDDSSVEKLNRANRDDSSRLSGPTIDVEATEVGKPKLEKEPQDEMQNKWKKPFPVPAARLQPVINNSQQVDQKKTPRIQTNPPSDVILRRTHSFEADQTFYRKYLELHARIANSCPSLHPSPVRLPARSASLRERYATRRGLREEGKSESPPTAPARPVSLPTAAPTPPAPRTNDALSANLTVRRSFVPPVRDEESETQRKAHAKRVRETRRSTQGVTLEDVKSAEQLVKKRNQQTTPIDQFLLEDARNKPSATQVAPARGRVVSPTTSPTDSTATSPSASEPTSPGSEASVTLPRPRLDDQDAAASALSTQAVIQRRRKPKRRSTGVVHVDMDEIDPDRQDSKGDDADGRVPNTARSEDKSRLGSVSSLASSKPEENGEVDYKKLYEAEYAANERLRETLRKTEEELEQVRPVKGATSTSEAEKRERRAMERKLSEMEEELKLLDKLQQENQRLRDENGALIRVISKLSK